MGSFGEDIFGDGDISGIKSKALMTKFDRKAPDMGMSFTDIAGDGNGRRFSEDSHTLQEKVAALMASMDDENNLLDDDAT